MANADTVLYSNMDTIDGPFNTGHTWSVFGNAPPGNFENAWASSFSVAQNSTATSIDVAVANYGDITQQIDIGVYSSDPSTGLPLTLISGTYLVDVPVGVSTPESVALSPLALTAGATYWVGVIPDSSSTSAYWLQNPYLLEQVAFSSDAGPGVGGTWIDSGYGSPPAGGAYPGEFDVVGVVPLPQASWMGLGLMGCLAIGRLMARRRHVVNMVSM
jgi:hypothetical protein